MVKITSNGLGVAVVNRASSRTRKKIIKSAIDLFNKHGIQNVTTKRIAATVGISSSNLTYHFKRKHDLIMTILVVLEENMRAALTAPRIDKNSKYSGENFAEILRTFWNFRCFFNALTYLLSKDKKLREEYFRFQNWALDTMDQGFQELINKGDFGPIRVPNNTRLLAENAWVQWLGWLRMQQIRNPTASSPDDEALYECALHFWSLVEPYFPEQDAKYLLSVYRSIFFKKAVSNNASKVAKRTTVKL